MLLAGVYDGALEDVKAGDYDLGIFASGFEERSRFVADQLVSERMKQVLVYGFAEMRGVGQRTANDAFFEEWCGAKPQVISTSDDAAILDALTRYLGGRQDDVKILVDYSSMSRLWYAAVVNWARFGCKASRLHVDMLYSVGAHRQRTDERSVREVYPIPGFEGRNHGLYKLGAVCGLGFNSAAIEAALELLEPDVVYAYYARPAAYQEYPLIVETRNSNLLRNRAEAVLPVSLFSVESVFYYLAQLLGSCREEMDLVVVPMGPKPHVLAALLTCLRLDDVACLRVALEGASNVDVGCTGTIVCTRVAFEAERDANAGPVDRGIDK